MADYPSDTTVDIIHPESDEGAARTKWRRVGYIAMTVLLTAIVVTAVVDNASEFDLWGVSSDRTRASGGGYELEVKFTTVSRPALASPFDVIVRKAGGFDGPVDIAIASNYLEMWDFQALYPDPSESTAEPDRVILTFDEPEGDVLRIFMDARIQPPEQRGTEGWVAVLDESGDEAVRVEFTTVVMP